MLHNTLVLAMNSVRIALEEQEDRILSPLAARSANAPRERPDTPCLLRTAFQQDRDRILHSKSFRRLKHKTQVFIAPQGDHYRTRLTHTLEVTQIARTVARALWLNEDLTEAIGLGHDLGHAPFGHAGEVALARVYPAGFRHNEQSLRVVEILEKEGRGLNLTRQVCEGILFHSKARQDIMARAWGTASTLEGQIIKVTDSVAYINHDIDDALRAGLIGIDDLPEECLRVLGRTHSTRINTMVQDLVQQNWWATGEGPPPDPLTLTMSEPILTATNALREFLFQRIYTNSRAKEDDEKVVQMIEWLYEYFVHHPDDMPSELLRINRERGEPIERAAVDYIAGMTDHYAIKVFQARFVPRMWGSEK
jgi:dGTPase